MGATDSDKDSKSSELTIGPSCIQFRLIIVKVEKFQSAISTHATLAAFRTLPLPPPTYRRRPLSFGPQKRASVSFSSPASRFRIRFYEFRAIAWYRTFLSLRGREGVERRKSEREISVYTIKVNFLVPLQPNDGVMGHVFYVVPLAIRTKT